MIKYMFNDTDFMAHMLVKTEQFDTQYSSGVN